MSDLQVSHALTTHSRAHTQTHTHTKVQIGYQSKIRGENKRSDGVPRQHSLLWFSDQPGNTLTPLHTQTHTHTYTDAVTLTGRRSGACTQAQSGIRTSHHITSHHITSHHTRCEGDLLSLQKENRADWKWSLKTLQSPSTSLHRLDLLIRNKRTI